MSRLAKLNNLANFRTAAELKSTIGKRVPPCQKCGCAILAILHTGAIVCPECYPDRGTGRGVAFEVIVLEIDGQPVAVDRRRELADRIREREFRVAGLIRFRVGGDEWAARLDPDGGMVAVRIPEGATINQVAERIATKDNLGWWPNRKEHDGRENTANGNDG